MGAYEKAARVALAAIHDNKANSVPVEAAPLAAAVGIAGARRIGIVRPLALQLPFGAIGEHYRRYVERPGAFVPVFRSAGVVPRTGRSRITPRLRKLVSRHIGEGRESLGVPSGCVRRIASWVTIEVEEERELYGFSTARSSAVPRAITGIATLYVGVNRIGAVAAGIRDDVAYRDLLADFGQDRGCVVSTRRGGGVYDVALMGHDWADLSIRTRVLVHGVCVVGAAVSGVPSIKAGDFVADKCRVRPTRSPENRFRYRGWHDLATVIGHVRRVPGEIAELKWDAIFCPRDTDYRRRRL